MQFLYDSQISASGEKMYHDAYTVQQVEPHNLTNFNFVAGMVPFLLNLILDVSLLSGPPHYRRSHVNFEVKTDNVDQLKWIKIENDFFLFFFSFGTTFILLYAPDIDRNDVDRNFMICFCVCREWLGAWHKAVLCAKKKKKAIWFPKPVKLGCYTSRSKW